MEIESKTSLLRKVSQKTGGKKIFQKHVRNIFHRAPAINLGIFAADRNLNFCISVNVINEKKFNSITN